MRILVKEQTRSFERKNCQQLKNKLKYGNEIRWKYERDIKLKKLYTEFLKEEPIYIPRKFRADNTYKGGDDEITVYPKLAEQTLIAEREILKIRADKNAIKLKNIDKETYEMFKSKVTNKNEVEELKATWNEKAKEDGTEVISKWISKIENERKIIQKEKSGQNAHTTLKNPQNQTSSQRRSAVLPPNRTNQQLTEYFNTTAVKILQEPSISTPSTSTAKLINLSFFSLAQRHVSLLTKGPKFTSVTQATSAFKTDLKEFTRRIKSMK